VAVCRQLVFHLLALLPGFLSSQQVARTQALPSLNIADQLFDRGTNRAVMPLTPWRR
jgi:hypothetical protein